MPTFSRLAIALRRSSRSARCWPTRLISLQTTLAEASTERDDAARALAAADQARAETAQQLAEAESTIETLEGDRADLEQRLAALGLDALRATSTLDERRARRWRPSSES